MGTDYVFHDSNPPGTVRTREPEKRGLSLIFPVFAEPSPPPHIQVGGIKCWPL
jgi:hypothetical protein